MTLSRAVVTAITAILVSQILTIVIHGFILAADYQPFKGTLLQSADAGPVADAVLARGTPVGDRDADVDLRVASAGWLGLGSRADAGTGWLELISSLFVGLTITLLAPSPRSMEIRAVAQV